MDTSAPGPSGRALLPAPRRVRPADLLPPVPVLPSHTAMWSDFAELDLSHLLVGHAPSLPTGWASDWTLTTVRDGRTGTAPVVDLTWDLVSGADPMIVPTWHPNKRAREGIKYVGATGRHHQFQSRFERRLLLAVEFDGLVDVTSQPFELEWHDGVSWRRHTPDFAVLTEHGAALVNVRPADLLNDKHRTNTAALAAVAGRAGWRCHTVVGYRSPAMPILEACASARFAPDNIGIAREVRQALGDGPLPFHEVAARTVCDPFARAMLRQLIWLRRVSVDLNRNLDDHTMVTLTWDGP